MRRKNVLRQLPLHLMLLPAVFFVIVFSYVPMAGIIIAFQDFIPAKGLFGRQEWIGFENFIYLFSLPDIGKVVFNTVFIATAKVIMNLVVPVIFALLLNEVRTRKFKRITQTLIYLPNFLSWVILGGILKSILSPEDGIVNKVLELLGMHSVYFLGDKNWFPYTVIITDIWQQFGFSTIIYLAALTNVDPTLYEAGELDGCGRWKMMLHITLPGILPIVVLMATLSLGNILNAGFDQIFNLYSPQVYETGDIIDTFVYRLGLLDAQYSLATAVGLAKSALACVLIVLSYYLAYRYADYRIF